MTSTRPYTRRELEGSRRATLQNLFKTHNLKGANQKSEILIDILVAYFASPAFAKSQHSPSRLQAPKPKLGSIDVQHAPSDDRRRGLRSVKSTGELRPEKRPVARIPGLRTVKTAVAKAGVLEPASGKASAMSVSAPAQSTIEAGPSRVVSPVPAYQLAIVTARVEELTTRIAQLKEQVAAQALWLTQETVERLLLERDEEWAARLREADRAWADKFREDRGSLVEEETARRATASTVQHPSAVFTEMSTSPPVKLGKRHHRGSVAGSPGLGEVVVGSLSPHKRPRIDVSALGLGNPSAKGDPPAALQSAVALQSPPRTPSPFRPGSAGPPRTPKAPEPSFQMTPRTPSPNHQGILPDQSMTPVIASDYFAPPHYSTGGKRSSSRNGRPIETLPFPIFATTPKAPGPPRSPTLDAPGSASRPRAMPDLVLTPGRSKAEPASRAVSAAHMELSTITESPGASRAGIPLSRRVASAGVASSRLLGPELFTNPTRPRTASPSRLRPSPTIPDAGFPTTPAYPTRRGYETTPATAKRKAGRGASSPAREYMSIALNGLASRESPSTLVTPGHRTMLGTERYRDTRFGDVPVVHWATPRMDLGGPETRR